MAAMKRVPGILLLTGGAYFAYLTFAWMPGYIMIAAPLLLAGAESLRKAREESE